MTCALTVNLLVEQVMITEVTFALVTVPDPPPTVHDCVGPLGCVRTATSYDDPAASGTGNANEPFELIVSELPPLSLTTTEPERPATVPPIV